MKPPCEPQKTAVALAASDSAFRHHQFVRGLAVAIVRLHAVSKIEALHAQGLPLAAAVWSLRVDFVTAWRWRKNFARDGLAGLFPGTPRSGRRRKKPTPKSPHPRAKKK